MGKTIVVLPPHVRREQVIKRCDRSAPGNFLARRLEPFRVLIKHRIYDVDEGLVGREKTVPSGEEIAFEPALTGMLAENFHDPPFRRQMIIAGKRVRHPSALRDFEKGAEPVRGGLIRTKDAEVPRVHIETASNRLGALFEVTQRAWM